MAVDQRTDLEITIVSGIGHGPELLQYVADVWCWPMKCQLNMVPTQCTIVTSVMGALCNVILAIKVRTGLKSCWGRISVAMPVVSGHA